MGSSASGAEPSAPNLYCDTMHKPIVIHGARRWPSLACAAAAALILSLWMTTDARASGASPYLPLNLSPEIERQVERVLVLGGHPVMTRPVPIAAVLEALPKACRRDAALCRRVRHYLDAILARPGSLRPVWRLQPQRTRPRRFRMRAASAWTRPSTPPGRSSTVRTIICCSRWAGSA